MPKLTKTLELLLEKIALTDATHEELAIEFGRSKKTIINNECRLRKILEKDSRVKLVIYFYNHVRDCGKI